MLKDNIITGKLISEVSHAIMMPANMSESNLENLEPEIRDALKDICDKVTDILIDVKSMRTEQLGIDEVVGMTGPKFFIAGLISAMIARDQLDEQEVPDIGKYCSTFATIGNETKKGLQNRLRNAISKVREG